MSAEKQYPVITISRQYAAGGRSVAELLSEKTGLEWYNKDLVRATAKVSGYSEEEITKEGEELSRLEKLLDGLMTNNYRSSHMAIYQAQKEVILDLAKKPCIIIGRCSNIILKEAGIPCLNIYLYADMDHRMKRAAELNDNGSADLQKYIETVENLRSTYYKTFTKHTAGSYEDYDLMLNTGLLGYEKCVEIILDVLNR